MILLIRKRHQIKIYVLQVFFEFFPIHLGQSIIFMMPPVDEIFELLLLK